MGTEILQKLQRLICWRVKCQSIDQWPGDIPNKNRSPRYCSRAVASTVPVLPNHPPTIARSVGSGRVVHQSILHPFKVQSFDRKTFPNQLTMISRQYSHGRKSLPVNVHIGIPWVQSLRGSEVKPFMICKSSQLKQVRLLKETIDH
jgi:hypothetical protein